MLDSLEQSPSRLDSWMTTSQGELLGLLSNFPAPPTEYRPAPFTILNDEYEPGRGERQLTALIESLTRAVARLAEIVPPRLSFLDTVPSTGIAHMHRTVSGGEVFYIVNASPAGLRSQAVLSTDREHVYAMEAKTGRSRKLNVERVFSGLCVEIEIPACGSLTLLTTDEVIAWPEDEASECLLQCSEPTAPIELVSAVRTSANVLAIDFCSLQVHNKLYPPENVLAANFRHWKSHEFDTNGWNNVIQYRDQITDRDQVMQSGSGGVVTYQLEIDPGVDLGNIRLVVECPELWIVAVNAHEATFTVEDTFRDPRFHWTLISEHLHYGTNEITLTARPFSVRQEIDQIYILGDFACEPMEQGFKLVPSRALTWGSWKAQGLPFYDAEVSYHLRLPAGVTKLVSSREGWGGALVIVSQDGREIGRTFESPWTVSIPSPSNEVEAWVVGLPINLYGPWHDPDHRWGVSSPYMWMGENVPSPPQPGARYAHIDLGLFRVPTHV